MDVSTDLCGIRLENPTILASGFLGVTKASIRNVARNGVGAVTIKSITPEPRKGHKGPVIITYESGMINAVGYSNPGLEEAKKEFSNLEDVGVPVIGSILGKDAKEFAHLAENFSDQGFCAFELPLSCPHTPGYGLLAGHETPEATYEITSAVKENTKLPVFVKISPNIKEIGRVVKAAEEAGADAITAVNTMGPGMVIDIKTAKPVLGFKTGGVSGPALRPIAVRCVYDVYESVRIPIIGTGGVTYGKDAIEMFMAGATAVGIGSGVYYRGIDVFKKVVDEIRQFMEQEGYTKLKEIIGIAHE